MRDFLNYIFQCDKIFVRLLKECFPIPNLAAFKEICPGGMGYTVSGSHRNKLYHHPAVRVQPPVNGKTQITQHVAKGTSPPPLPAKEEPVEALTISQKSEPEVAVREGESGQGFHDVSLVYLCICACIFPPVVLLTVCSLHMKHEVFKGLCNKYLIASYVIGTDFQVSEHWLCLLCKESCP